MKTYEAMILLDNREVKKGWQPLKEVVDSILTKTGAEIVVSKRWDERKLAFEIKKQRRATYYLTFFQADPESISEIHRGLRLSSPVLRSLILRCEEIPPEAYEPEREFDLDRADESPDEEAETAESTAEADDSDEGGDDVEDIGDEDEVEDEAKE